MRVLIVAAHPDDEVLGCGGTIARMSREDEVSILILGEGITARFAQRGDADPRALEQLHDQAREAGKRLGARNVMVEDLPDNRFDQVALLDIVKRVERWIDEIQPAVVYTHHRGDLNIDHALTHRAVVTATRPLPGCPVREVYAFEVPSSTDWAFAGPGEAFRPTVFIDIADTITAKLDAIRIYDTEARPFPHPRSEEALRAAALRWGSVAGLEAAEAFELIRAIRGRA